MLSRDVAGPKHVYALAARGLVLSDPQKPNHLRWDHLALVRGLISIVQSPGLHVPHRGSSEGMTGQSKGLGLANLPPPLFVTTSIEFIIQLRKFEPGSEHIVLILSSNIEPPASVNLWLSVDATIVT